MANLNDMKQGLEVALARYLPKDCPDLLREAMQYSLLSEGKRFRPCLLISVCKAYSGNGNGNACEGFACALEMIHTYSLIHDDLPAIDNDDTRRGRPASHKKFGEAIAILTGDAFLNRAYEIMADVVAHAPLLNNALAMAEIARAAGAGRLIGGQVIDITANDPDIDTMFYINKNKTAALFEAALVAGGYLAGTNESEIEKLRGIGADLGMLFQIKDDLADADHNQSPLELNPNLDMSALIKHVYDGFNSLACDSLEKTQLREIIDIITGGEA